MFFDGSFVRINYDGQQVLLERSDNGADWVGEPVNGLPGYAYFQNLHANADGLVAIAQVERERDFVDPHTLIVDLGLLTQREVNNLCDLRFDGVDSPIVATVCDFDAIYELEQEFYDALDNAETEEEAIALEEEFWPLIEELYEGEEVLRLELGDEFFDELADAFLAEEAFYTQPYDRVVASSTDGTNWSATILPQVEVEPGGFEYLAGSAVSGDTISVLVSVEPAYFDPNWLLFEYGLITEDQLNAFCSIDFDGEGSPIIVNVCDFDEIDAAFDEYIEAIDDARTDAERIQIEEEFSALIDELYLGEEILRLEPGDEFYDSLAEGLLAQPRTVVLAGTLGGEFQSVDLPGVLYPNSVVGTQDGFIVTAYDDDGLIAFQSTDGLTWEVAERTEEILEDTGGAVDLVANEDLTLAVVYEYASEDANVETRVIVSDDLGETWEENAIPTELFGTSTQAVAGPAGFAALIQGTADPVENGEGPDTFEVISEDGYVTQYRLSRDRIRLRAPDGTLIHEPVDLSELYDVGEIEDVIRLDEGGETLTWLDPETGEDLVVVTFAELDEAIWAAFDEYYASLNIEPVIAELWFSTDGETWELLETFEPAEGVEQNASLVAVGDDETLVLVQSWVEPPEGLFAFEEEGREPTEAELQAVEEYYAIADTSDLVRVEVSAADEVDATAL